MLDDEATQSQLLFSKGSVVKQYLENAQLDTSLLVDSVTSSSKSWKKVYFGGALLRSSQWYTFGDCNCKYVYGDDEWPSNPAPEWMIQLGKCLHQMLELESEVPNSCNCNLYLGSQSSLGWHSDSEKLFVKGDGKATIISISFGASRVFEYRRKNIPKGPPPEFCSLGNFDVCAMVGKMQLFYEHRVPTIHGTPVAEPRINLTYRHIHRHDSKCPVARSS